MTLVKSRSYLGYVVLLCLGITAMIGYANANADDKRSAASDIQAEKIVKMVKADAAAKAQLKPAAGTPEANKTEVKKAEVKAAAKKAALKPAAGKSKKKAAAKQASKYDDDAYDDSRYARYDSDPLEPMNRAFFEFNRTVDGVLLRPVASIYRGVVPERGRTAVTHALNNLYAPVTFANSVFQGDGYNSFATLWRFIINTTFGIGGLFDAASEIGLTNRMTDMGQTFAMYGADEGPYIVIPLLGPSNVRDGLGRVGDTFLFPPNYADEWAVPLAIGATSAIDARSNNMELIDGLYRSSLDPYATFRSAYMQRRAEAVRRAKEARDASINNAH